MSNECSQCGQKLRPMWVRCPRCRALLPGSAERVNAKPPAATGPTVTAAWLAAAGVLLVLGMAMAVFTRQTQTHPPIAETTSEFAEAAGAVEAAVEPEDAEASGPVSVPSTNFAAIDSRRAGQAAYAAGDFAAALTAMESAVAAAPADPDAHNNLGQLLVRQARAADALPHFDEAVRLLPNRWDYHFNRGRAYGLVDRWPDAVADYRTAATIFPDDHATLYNLGLALMRVKDYTAAASALEQAVNTAPDEPGFLITLGTAYVGAAQPDRARAAFEKFLQIAPEDVEAAKVKALLQALADTAS